MQALSGVALYIRTAATQDDIKLGLAVIKAGLDKLERRSLARIAG